MTRCCVRRATAAPPDGTGPSPPRQPVGGCRGTWAGIIRLGDTPAIGSCLLQDRTVGEHVARGDQSKPATGRLRRTIGPLGRAGAGRAGADRAGADRAGAARGEPLVHGGSRAQLASSDLISKTSRTPRLANTKRPRPVRRHRRRQHATRSERPVTAKLTANRLNSRCSAWTAADGWKLLTW
jgi:hypothetical protein